MKQKDIALILVIVFISALVALGFSKLVFKSGTMADQAEKVDVISSAFERPDRDYFNDTSVNPTRLIEIKDNTKPDEEKAAATSTGTKTITNADGSTVTIPDDGSVTIIDSGGTSSVTTQ